MPVFVFEFPVKVSVQHPYRIPAFGPPEPTKPNTDVGTHMVCVHIEADTVENAVDEFGELLTAQAASR